MSDWLNIHALADEQLQGEEKEQARARLSQCDQSRREFEAVTSLKKALAAREGTITCEETWSRCRRRLDEIEKTQRIESFVGRYSWALCSVFLFFIIGAAMFNRIGGGESLNTSDVPRLSASMGSFLSSPRSQAPSDIIQFTREAAGQAPVRVQAPEQIQVVQGGSAIINGRHHVRIDFADSRGPVSLYAVEGATVFGVEPIAGRPGFGRGLINGQSCVTWSEAGYTVLLVGNRSVDDLCAFAQVVGRH